MCNFLLSLEEHTVYNANENQLLSAFVFVLQLSFIISLIQVLKLAFQVVWIPMGTNCAPLVADLFLFCYEKDFMMTISNDKQTDVNCRRSDRLSGLSVA